MADLGAIGKDVPYRETEFPTSIPPTVTSPTTLGSVSQLPTVDVGSLAAISAPTKGSINTLNSSTISNYSAVSSISGIQVAGTVTLDGVTVQRKVRIYSRSSGVLLNETTSASDGRFSIQVFHDGPVYAIALDDDTAPDMNALVFDRIIPAS